MSKDDDWLARAIEAHPKRARAVIVPLAVLAILGGGWVIWTKVQQGHWGRLMALIGIATYFPVRNHLRARAKSSSDA
jgi:hypothetical protein